MNLFSNSLINKIKFLGFILAILMLFILFIAYKTSNLNTKKTYIHHAIKMTELLDTNVFLLQRYLHKHDIQRVQYKDISVSLKNSKLLISDALIREVFVQAGLELYKNNNDIFFVLKHKNKTLYYKNSRSIFSTTVLPMSLSAILIFLLIYGMYHFIRGAFTPLVRLEENIQHFSKAEEIDLEYESANDEIANIANAFYSAIEHNKRLKAQKDMYICMVMHEISTPLTKAKFITHFMENEEDKDKLNALFNSMQYELNKVYEFERISTKMLSMKMAIFSINALIEDVCDVLLLDKEHVTIDADNIKKVFDYDLFIVAVKNLIDNALKYSKDNMIHIEIKEEYLCIRNLSLQSEALDVKKLLEPFKQGNECNSGMGLGLFLVNEIITKHNFSLEYDFRDNYHVFQINFFAMHLNL